MHIHIKSACTVLLLGEARALACIAKAGLSIQGERRGTAAAEMAADAGADGKETGCHGNKTPSLGHADK